LGTYEDLIESNEEQEESQGKAEEQEADNTAESRRKSLCSRLRKNVTKSLKYSTTTTRVLSKY